MTKSHTTWSCETCGARYDTQQDAAACEALPLVDEGGAQVGDFIRLTRDFGMIKHGAIGYVRKRLIRREMGKHILRLEVWAPWHSGGDFWVDDGDYRVIAKAVAKEAKADD